MKKLLLLLPFLLSAQDIPSGTVPVITPPPTPPPRDIKRYPLPPALTEGPATIETIIHLPDGGVIYIVQSAS